MGEFGGNILSGLMIFSIILIVIFLACREIVCWYFKINQTVSLLTEVRNLLAATKGSRSDSQSSWSGARSEPTPDSSIHNYTVKLVELGCRVTQPTDDAWEVLLPSGAREFARSADQFIKIASRYIAQREAAKVAS